MSRGRKVLIVIILVFIGLIAGCFLVRGQLLQWAFKKAQVRIHEDYKACLTASSVRFTGLDQVTLKNMTLQPDGADTFLRVTEASVKISFANLLRGKIVFDQINIKGADLTIYNEGERNNFAFLRAVGRNKKSDISNTPLGYRDRAMDGEKKLLRLLHTAFSVQGMHIFYQDTVRTESLFIPSFTYDTRELSGTIIDQEKTDTIHMSMYVDRNTSHTYEWTIEHYGNDTIYLPFLDRERGLQCRFQRIDAHVSTSDENDKYTISASVALQDFHLHHWRLSNEDVILPDARFTGLVRFTDQAVELDSSSTLRLHSAACHLFARYELQPDTMFALAIHMPEVAADSFFQALPIGMFNTLKGISCTGTLAYDLTFAIHTNNPDSLEFYSAMRQKNLRIQHYGEENYARINGAFMYDAYDKDRLVRRIMIGPENPAFTPLDQMSAYLPQAVLQAEDPSFMQHRGFYLEAFRESIVKNYKERRFARGGSTISMQLVKNVFLSHDKTVSRKAEEALIVYLIENLGLVPKERMLEVYLNVIEWGPNVYGIGEASRFYFNKRPSQLSLPESLFLASIIPRPKGFQYQFDKEGQLRASMGDYFKILTTRMVWRGVLNPSDTVGLAPKVTLRGPAKHMVTPQEAISTENEDTE